MGRARLPSRVYDVGCFSMTSTARRSGADSSGRGYSEDGGAVGEPAVRGETRRTRAERQAEETVGRLAHVGEDRPHRDAAGNAGVLRHRRRPERASGAIRR